MGCYISSMIVSQASLGPGATATGNWLSSFDDGELMAGIENG